MNIIILMFYVGRSVFHFLMLLRIWFVICVYQSTLSSRRAAVLTFLSGLSNQELSPLLRLMMSPFQFVLQAFHTRTHDVHDVHHTHAHIHAHTDTHTGTHIHTYTYLPVSKQLGFLNLLEYIVKQLRSFASAHLETFLTVILFVFRKNTNKTTQTNKNNNNYSNNNSNNNNNDNHNNNNNNNDNNNNSDKNHTSASADITHKLSTDTGSVHTQALSSSVEAQDTNATTDKDACITTATVNNNNKSKVCMDKISPKKSRTVRQLVFKRMNQLFDCFPSQFTRTHTQTNSFLHAFLRIAEPQIRTMASLQTNNKRSALLDCIVTMIKHRDLLRAWAPMPKYMYILPSLFSCLSAAQVPEDVVKAVLTAVESLLSFVEECDSDSESVCDEHDAHHHRSELKMNIDGSHINSNGLWAKTLLQTHISALLTHIHTYLTNRVHLIKHTHTYAHVRYKARAHTRHGSAKSVMSLLPLRMLDLLCRVSPYTRNPHNAEQLFNVLIPFLHQPHSFRPETKHVRFSDNITHSNTQKLAQILQILTQLVHVMPEPHTRRCITFLSRQFYVLHSRKCRELLCLCFTQLAKRVASLTEVAHILTELHAVSAKRVGEYDFERRSRAYGMVREKYLHIWTNKQLLPVVYCALYQCTDADLGIRQDAAHCLSCFITGRMKDNNNNDNNNNNNNKNNKDTNNLHTRTHSTDQKTMQSDNNNNVKPINEGLLLSVVFPALKKGLKHSVEVIRHTFVELLSHMLKTHQQQHANTNTHTHVHTHAHTNMCTKSPLSVFGPLLNSNPDLDFFHNIAHIQIHRRTIALARIRSICEQYKQRIQQQEEEHVHTQTHTHTHIHTPSPTHEQRSQESDKHNEQHDAMHVGMKHPIAEHKSDNKSNTSSHSHQHSRQRPRVPAPPLHHTVITQVLIPLASHFIYNYKPLPSAHTQAAKNKPISRQSIKRAGAKHGLLDEAVNCIGWVSYLLPWNAYYQLLLSFLAQVSRKAHIERILVRVVCAIVEQFHFDIKNVGSVSVSVSVSNALNKMGIDLKEQKQRSSHEHKYQSQSQEGPIHTNNNDNNHNRNDNNNDNNNNNNSNKKHHKQKILNILSRRLLPSLHRHLTGKQKFEVVRVQVAIAIVKLLQHMPAHYMQQQLPRLLSIVCGHLKRRFQGARDMSRQTLVQIAYTVGASHFYVILKMLIQRLTRGFELHVLEYVTYALLQHITPRIKLGSIDYCIPLLSKMFMEHLLGEIADQKQVQAIQSRCVCVCVCV